VDVCINASVVRSAVLNFTSDDNDSDINKTVPSETETKTKKSTFKAKT